MRRAISILHVPHPSRSLLFSHSYPTTFIQLILALRLKAKPINCFDLPFLAKLSQRLEQVLLDEATNGIGLAAPQLNESFQMFSMFVLNESGGFESLGFIRLSTHPNLQRQIWRGCRRW